MGRGANLTEKPHGDTGAPVDTASPILILGLPRSGTTWLAKIFDSHPDTLYRHEPDIALREDGLPAICTPEEWPRYRAAARDYLLRLLELRTFRVAGPLPYFAKSYRGPATAMVRNASALALSAAAKVMGAGKAIQQIPVPDYIAPRNARSTRTVVKSVSADGRVGLFAEAMPEARIIYLIRNPFGQVSSRLRGISLGKMGMPVDPNRWTGISRLKQARAHELTRERFVAMAPLEQLAWYWMIMNEKAIDELSGRPSVRVVRYEDLCDDPVEVTRELFAFAGLDLLPQTEAFIAESSQYEGAERYYQVKKNTQEVAQRWRTELAGDEQERIRDVVSRAASLMAFGYSQ